MEELSWVKESGVSKIINLRSENENERFLKEAFNESQIADELNLIYISIPIARVSDYTPENLDHFISEITSTKDTLLIHSAGAGRVTYFMMAYLVKHEGYTKEEACSLGKQLTYKSYLDLLLSNE